MKLTWDDSNGNVLMVAQSLIFGKTRQVDHLNYGAVDYSNLIRFVSKLGNLDGRKSSKPRLEQVAERLINWTELN